MLVKESTHFNIVDLGTAQTQIVLIYFFSSWSLLITKRMTFIYLITNTYRDLPTGVLFLSSPSVLALNISYMLRTAERRECLKRLGTTILHFSNSKAEFSGMKTRRFFVSNFLNIFRYFVANAVLCQILWAHNLGSL